MSKNNVSYSWNILLIWKREYSNLIGAFSCGVSPEMAAHMNHNIAFGYLLLLEFFNLNNIFHILYYDLC